MSRSKAREEGTVSELRVATMTKVGEEATVGELMAIKALLGIIAHDTVDSKALLERAVAIADRLFPPGMPLTSGQGGGVRESQLGQPSVSVAAPANPSPVQWAVDILGRPVPQAGVLPSLTAQPPPASGGPFYEQYECPSCHNMREWTMNRKRWPNAVCMICFRGPRGTQ